MQVILFLKNESNIKQKTENGFTTVIVAEKQTEITLEFDITVRKVEAFTADNKDKYFSLWHGNLILGTTNDVATVNTEDVEDVNCKPVFIPLKEENNTLVWDVK